MDFLEKCNLSSRDMWKKPEISKMEIKRTLSGSGDPLDGDSKDNGSVA